MSVRIDDTNRAALKSRVQRGLVWAVYAAYDGNGNRRGDLISSHRSIETADARLRRINRYSRTAGLVDLEDALDRESYRFPA